STNTTPTLCRSAIARNSSIRFRKPARSCSQSRWCRKTRTLVKPSCSAQLSSRSMVLGSKVSACHISSWLMAVLGVKLPPASQGCLAYQAVGFSVGQGAGAASFFGVAAGGGGVGGEGGDRRGAGRRGGGG